METTTAVTSAATTPIEAEPIMLQKRIGSTLYTVNAYFSSTESETLADKILRLARNDGLDFQSEQARMSLRMGQLQERRKAV